MSDEQRVPRLVADLSRVGGALTPAEGFLLSRIDGKTPWSQLRLIAGIPGDEVDRCLERWVEEGVVTVNGSSRTAEGGVEEGIDLSPEEQRTILEFERTLDRPYHDLLGVPRDADIKQIKRAYFVLSRAYHPDRFFRRELGTFAERLERIFRKVVEAYELLSDPATRAEVERSMAQAPPTPEAQPETQPETPAATTPAMSQKRAVLERLRRQFRMPEKILTERRFKARQFSQAALIAVNKERWLEAGASIRLAIAFDPWEDSYKHTFAGIQGELHKLRADEAVQAAEESLEANSRQSALRLFEEALSYRPCDIAINQKAAKLAIDLGEFETARDCAETLVDVEPGEGGHLRLLAKALAGEGLVERAIETLDKALEINPADSAARSQLAMLKRSRVNAR